MDRSPLSREGVWPDTIHLTEAGVTLATGVTLVATDESAGPRLLVNEW